MKKRLSSYLIMLFSLMPFISKAQTLDTEFIADSLDFASHKVILYLPVDFTKKESVLSHGGKIFAFSQVAPISFIAISESQNSQFDFGTDCIVMSRVKLDDRTIERGFCQSKGYYRVDYILRSRLQITYQWVIESELEGYEALLDKVKVIELP